MAGNPVTSALADRVRVQLPPYGSVREVAMFGGLSFMVDERLAVAAGRDGDLLVRVDPDDYDGLLMLGAIPARMRNGREMGRGWLTVPAERIRDDDELGRWIELAVAARPAAGSGR